MKNVPLADAEGVWAFIFGWMQRLGEVVRNWQFCDSGTSVMPGAYVEFRATQGEPIYEQPTVS
jgi:hypothetical protein